MQKLQLEQKLGHKLSGQQIQFMKLLQLPTVALNGYIAREVAINPLLEEREELDHERSSASEEEEEPTWMHYCADGYLGSRKYTLEERSTHDHWIPAPVSLQEKLTTQLHLLPLSELEYAIGAHLIGSLDEDGLFPYDLEIIVQDLHVMYYLEVSVDEVEEVLMAIQRLDPPGIAARNLQECLLLQLQAQKQSDPIIQLAQQVVSKCFKAFTAKHYEAIIKKLGITDRQLFKEALSYISRLNPRPGGGSQAFIPNYLSPDFVVLEQAGRLSVELVHYPVYKPRFNKKYVAMLEAYEKKSKKDLASQELVVFLRKKLEDAKWFIEALSQRNQTLLKTMDAIVQLQKPFFLAGEEINTIRPMVLQNVAHKIGMDPSTVSRIVNQKSVQGRFGIYPLKFFFSEGMRKSTGEDISNKVIKNRILELINSENKQEPYADGTIEAFLAAEGYPIARRTVAKYREQLHLPVARLRRVLL